MSDQRLIGFDQRSSAWLRARPTLEGRAWVIEFKWVNRAQSWIFTLSDATGAIVVDGVAVVVSTDLLGGIPHSNRPPGQLWIHDTSGRREEPGRQDLGQRHRVLYRPAATVAAATGSQGLV